MAAMGGTDPTTPEGTGCDRSARGGMGAYLARINGPVDVGGRLWQACAGPDAQFQQGFPMIGIAGPPDELGALVVGSLGDLEVDQRPQEMMDELVATAAQ
jgi:hypothetical protein